MSWRSGTARMAAVLPPLAGAAAAAAGAAVLAGWWLDLAAPGGFPRRIKPLTALGLVLSGGALVAASLAARSAPGTRPPVTARLAGTAAVLAGAIGLTTLLEHLTGWNPGFDNWLLPQAAAAAGYVGRIPVDSASCFVLIAAAVRIALHPQQTRRTLAASTACGSLVLAFAMVAVVSHLAPALRTSDWGRLRFMALPTAILFAGLAHGAVSLARQQAAGAVLASFSSHLFQLAGFAGALGVTFALSAWSEHEVVRVNDVRLQSFLLAGELRQSGDDLTRMARTYVVTGDPIYRQRFQDIIDIRDGRKPRPVQYVRPYWDLVAASGAPRAPTVRRCRCWS